MNSWPHKDPNEELDYQLDWTLRLETGETLATSNFILASGTVVLGVSTLVGALTTVWVSGGTEGESAVITNRVTTSAGRTYDESVRLRVRSN